MAERVLDGDTIPWLELQPGDVVYRWGKKYLVVTCLICERVRFLHSRECCGNCWMQEKRAGRIDELPRKTRKIADVIDDWNVYRLRGMTKRQASVAMGYAKETLEMLLARAERRGYEVTR